MKRFAQVVIMLVRLLVLVELGLGGYVASGKGIPYFKLHIGIGFAVSMLLLLLAIVAAVKRKVVPVILAAAFAVLLPFLGLKQLPIRLGAPMSLFQWAHIVVALLTIGIAEMTYATIKKA